MRPRVAPAPGVVALALALLVGEGRASAERVAVVRLEFVGEIPAAVQQTLRERLVGGLTATGLEVTQEEEAWSERGGVTCATAACRRAVAGRLGCRYLVGGEVKGEDRSFRIKLWLADGFSGEVAATASERCEICGLQAVGQKIELCASALRAKVEAARVDPGRVMVVTLPVGASIAVDGDPVGPAPRELELAAGTHRITVTAPGHLAAARSVSVVAGVQERVEVRLIPAPRQDASRLPAWIVGGTALASLVAGIGLFAVNGERDCGGEPGQECPRDRDTSAAAWTLTGLGLAGLAGGAYLFFRGRSHHQPRVALVPAGLGLGLQGEL